MKACIEFFKFVKERVLSQTQIFILISLKLGDINLWYFKLRLFDLKEFIVWNIRYGIQR